MEPFETTLTGSDGLIDGIVSPLGDGSPNNIYQFVSLDDSLHLTIAKNESGKWVRVAGSEPYFSGWVDELAERVTTFSKQ